MVDINKRISLVEKMTKYLGIVVAIQAMEAFCTSIAFCISEIQNRMKTKQYELTHEELLNGNASVDQEDFNVG